MNKVNVPTFSEFVTENEVPQGSGPSKEEMLESQFRQNSQAYPMEDEERLPMMPPPRRLPQMTQQQNPFELQRYSNVNVPDTPLQFGGGIAESLLNDNEVPEKIKEQHWWVFHKDNTLTFLDEERKKMKMLSFDIAKVDILNTIPYYDYDFDQELQFTVLRNVFETKLDRALGFKGTAQRNERIVLQSQFQENRMIQDSEQNHIKEGFFKRLLGRR